MKDEEGKFMCKSVSPLDPSRPPKWNSGISVDHILVWKDMDMDGCRANGNNQVGSKES